MKKCLSMLLAVILTLSVAAVSVSAYSPAENPKADKDFLNRIDSMTDEDKADFIVQTAFENYPTQAQINAAVAEKTDIDPRNFQSTDELREYYRIWRSVRDEMNAQAVLANMAKMGVTLDDVKTVDGELYNENTIGRKGMPYAYTLTKAQAEYLLDMDEVTDIFVLYPTGELIIPPEEKLSLELIKRTTQVSDNQKIGVWVWTTDVTDDMINRLINEAYGENFIKTATEQMYRAARTAVMADYYDHANQEFVDSIGVPEEDRVFISTLTPSFIVRLTVNQIWSLAYMNKVVSLERYENVINISDEAAAKCQYLEPFSSWLNKKTGQMALEIYAYRELYTKADDSGEPIWAIVFAADNIALPWMARCGGIVGGRLISDIGGMGMSDTGYFLYDARENNFIDLTKVSAAKYTGLAEALEELKIGNPIGDMDYDKEITIFDATRMQRILAGMQGFSEDDDEPGEEMTSGFKYEDYADFDRDGSFTIMDATAIQRHLVGLE